MALERGLHLAAESLFDIGNHVLTAHFGVSARDYEEVPEQLARQGGPLRGAAREIPWARRIPNLLAHDCLRIDPERVRQMAARAPRDFSEFARALDGWLDSLGRESE